MYNNLYNIMIKAGNLPGYLLSCMDNDYSSLHKPFPECSFAILEDEYKNADEAFPNASGWYGIREISSMFNSPNLCLLVDYWGGGCGNYVELDDTAEYWSNPTPEELLWSAIEDTVERNGEIIRADSPIVVSFDSLEFVQQHYYEMFDAFLRNTEFELVSYDEPDEDGNCYGVVDLQGGNLGNIESDRFGSVMDVVERMDVYITDYYTDAIENNWPDANEDVFRYDYATMAQLGMLKSNDRHLCGDDFDVIDVLCNHANEIYIDGYMIWKKAHTKSRY